MAGLKYDDLPEKVRKEIEEAYPGREDREPGKMPDGSPDWNDPRNWMTEEEMDEFGITDSTPRSEWEPKVKNLPARKLPVPIQQRDVKGPKMMLGGPMENERGTRSMNEWVDETEMGRTINKEREDYYRERKGLPPIPEMPNDPSSPDNRMVEMLEHVYATNYSETMTRREFQDYTGYFGFTTRQPPVNEEVLRNGETNILDAAIKMAGVMSPLGDKEYDDNDPKLGRKMGADLRDAGHKMPDPKKVEETHTLMYKRAMDALGDKEDPSKFMRYFKQYLDFIDFRRDLHEDEDANEEAKRR